MDVPAQAPSHSPGPGECPADAELDPDAASSLSSELRHSNMAPSHSAAEPPTDSQGLGFLIQAIGPCSSHAEGATGSGTQTAPPDSVPTNDRQGTSDLPGAPIPAQMDSVGPVKEDSPGRGRSLLQPSARSSGSSMKEGKPAVQEPNQSNRAASPLGLPASHCQPETFQKPDLCTSKGLNALSQPFPRLMMSAMAPENQSTSSQASPRSNLSLDPVAAPFTPGAPWL